MDQSNSSPQTPQQEAQLSNPPQEPTRSDPWIGKVLDGQFEILELVGRGGMGEVYKAHAANLDKIVAVKIINRAMLVDEASLRRLQQEAKTLAALDHPNIPRIQRVLTPDFGGLALVVDYMEGRSLADELKLSGPLDADRFQRVFCDILQALTYTHARAIVHRDIKPSNIFLSRLPDGSERGMLIDFGLAKSLESFEQRLTQTGAVVGTIAYMSPEQLLGQPADARSDLYALGCVMFEAATGNVPFAGATPFEVAQQHLSNTVPPIEGKQFAVASAIVHRATRKAREERFSSAAEMLEAVRSGRCEAKPLSGGVWHRWRRRLLGKQPSRWAPAVISIILLGTLCISTGLMFLPKHKDGDSTSVTESHYADPDAIIDAIDRNANNPVKVQALQQEFDAALRPLPTGKKYSYYEKISTCAASHNLDRLFEEELNNELTCAPIEPQSTSEIYGAGNRLFEHYKEKHQYPQAIAAMNLLIEKLDPVQDIVDHKELFQDARLRLAELYDQLKRPNDARKLEMEVMQRCEQEGSYYWNRAYIAMARTIAEGGDPKRALSMIDDWQKRFGLTPKGEELIYMDNYYAHYAKYNCYLMLGDNERAQQELAKAETMFKAAAQDNHRRGSPEKLYQFLSGRETLRQATSSKSRRAR